MKFRAILNDSYDLEEISQRRHSENPYRKSLIYFGMIWLILNILAIIYVKCSKFIYFWDSSTYWDISRKIASGALSDGSLLRNVYNSFAEQDYNYLAALPSAFISKIFGTSRLVYILGLVNMYLFPSFVMIYILSKKISKAPKITSVIVLMLCPSSVFLTCNGFVDIGGFLMCLICFNLYFQDKTDNDKLWHYAVIGVLLTLLMLWRRWYAFFSVSFVTAMLADCVLFRKKWYKSALTIVVIAILLTVFFRGFLTQRLMQNYGKLYSDYKFSAMTDFKLITRYFGMIFIATLAVSSIVLAIKKQENRTLFMWIQMLVCLFMFISTQTHGQQHLLLYIPSLIMLTLISVKHITKEWAFVGISLMAIIHSVNVYIPRTQPTNIREIKHIALVPNFSMLPVSTDYAEEIVALKQKLDTTVYDGDTLGVLASSFTLNEDILINAEPSFGIKSIRDNYIVSLPQVDSRDRDLTPLYNVNYILVAIPAQTHLADGSQTVVTEAVNSFANYTDIATAYEEIYDCEAQLGDITVKLFHRVRDEYDSDILEFQSRLYH